MFKASRSGVFRQKRTILKKTAVGLAVLGVWIALTSLSLAEPLSLFYQGVRPLGMGGAFTAVADDENALFYNPAGLNKIEGFGGVEILSPLVEISEDTVDFYKDIKDVADATAKAEQISKASDLLRKYIGKRLHARTSLFPNVTLHNFGLGILAQGNFDGVVNDVLSPDALEVDGTVDLALLVSGAMGFHLLDGPFRVGLTGKVVHRQVIDQTYTANDLAQPDSIDLDKDLKKGTGYGFDLGLLYTLPLILEPSIGLTLQNIGDIDVGDAGTINQQLNAGVALELPIPIGLGSAVVALDIVDITKELGTDNDIAKRIQTGLEYRLPIILSLRAGLHQGYGSLGASLDLWLLKLDYAYYTEEVGAFAGQTPDQRHAAKLTIGF